MCLRREASSPAGRSGKPIFLRLTATHCKAWKIGSFGSTGMRQQRNGLRKPCSILSRDQIENKESNMKKFVIFHYGFEMPTPEIMEAWSKWFASLGEKMFDLGSPLGPGREISSAGTKEL